MENEELISLNNSIELEELSFEQLEERLELVSDTSCGVNTCQCGTE